MQCFATADKSGKYYMPLVNNKNLEDLFNMPNSNESDDNIVEDTNPVDTTESSLAITEETLQAIDKIETALPAVKGLEASDNEMDELAAKATESFDELMDLGMQVDSRYASEIFSVASNMLGHAITAKTSKMNKKLKMIDLQLKKARLDQTGGGDDTPPAQGRILDRNELLRTLANDIDNNSPSSENIKNDKQNTGIEI